jgi:hypothetical protein
MKCLSTASLVAAALFALTPAHADTIWNFNTPSGNLGSTHNYVGSDGTIITATAFGPGSPSLFGKPGPGDEIGVGLTNDPSGENEITFGSFIQLDLSNIKFASPNMSFMADSTTAGETWAVFGSNTPGTFLFSNLLASCTGTDGPGNACEVPNNFNLPGAGNFKFLDVTAAAGGNVLLSQVDAVVVPGPIAGAGLPGLVAACGGLLALARRRRRRSRLVDPSSFCVRTNKRAGVASTLFVFQR